MKISNTLGAIVAAGLACSSLQVLADPSEAVAKLAMVEGKVMVNNGSQYVAATNGTALYSGEKVVAAKDSSVSLVYKDGCIKQLKGTSMLTVGPVSECTAKKTNERVYVAEAAGATATDAPSAAAGSVGAAAGGVPGAVVVAGGVAVVGTTASVVSGNSNANKNASPQ